MTNLSNHSSRRQQILAQLSAPTHLAEVPPTAKAQPAAPVVAIAPEPCPAPRQLEDLVAGRLRGKTLATVADHVADCPRCAEYAEEIHRMVVRPALAQAQASRRRVAFGPAHIAGLTLCAMLVIVANSSMIDGLASAPAANPALSTTAAGQTGGAMASGAAPATVVVPAENLAAPTRAAEPVAAPVTPEPPAKTAAASAAPAAAAAAASSESTPAAVAEPAAPNASTNNEKQKETAPAPSNSAGQVAVGAGKSAETAKPEAAKIAPKATDQPEARASAPAEPQGDKPAARKIESKGTTPARLLPARI